MKLIFEFARIAAFCFAGEVCHLVLPLPIPASVYGLMLLLAALRFGVVKLEQVRTAALFLTGIFPLLFVPAAAEVDGKQVKVWCDKVKKPRQVRYGWQPYTDANLINGAGVPASTFKSIEAYR